MAGGYWGKGQNPFWNYDSDAALNDRRRLDAEYDAHSTKLENERIQSQADSDFKYARLQISNLLQEKENLNAKLKDIKAAFFKIAMRSNIFNRALNEIIESHPEIKDEILDSIQKSRDFYNQQEQLHKWWDWVHSVELKEDIEYLQFPYEKRQSKK